MSSFGDVNVWLLVARKLFELNEYSESLKRAYNNFKRRRNKIDKLCCS